MLIYSDVAKDGRVTIPATFRKKLDIDKGDKVVFRQENGVLEILTQEQLLAEARAALSDMPEDVSLTKELLVMRRKEVANERHEADIGNLSS